MKNKKLVTIIFERISKWGDVEEMVKKGELDLFFNAPSISKDKLVYKNSTLLKTTENLKSAITALQDLAEDSFIAEKIKNTLMSIAENLDSRGELLHPVRYALSGVDKSPDPFIISEILGKNETLSRLQKAI